MEAKCNLCEVFGEKIHCHNCKIFNNAREHAPQEITCSLEEFVEYIENNDDISERYGAGDYKTITLYTGEEVKMVILDLGRDQLASGGTAKVSLGILEMEGLYNMNPRDTNAGSWRDSAMRKRMERIFKLLPPILQAHIKPVVKHTSAGQGNAEIIATTDKLFLFSEVEIRGKTDYSYPGEDTQYDYFKAAINRQFSNYKWLRSPYYSHSYAFCCIYDAGSSGGNNAGNSTGVAFGFCI